MKKIETVIFDMDGTALNEEKEMDKVLVKYSEKIKAKGVELMIASGRLEYMVYDYMDELNIDTPIIGCNGATITKRNQKEALYAARLDPNKLQSLIEKATELDQIFHIFTLDGLVGRTRVARLEYYATANEKKTAEQQVPIFIGDEYLTKEALKDAVKFLLVTEDKEAFEAIRVYAKSIGLEAVQSGDTLLDIMAKGISKGHALQKLHDMGRINLETTMVFGDNYNDLEMLEVAKYPIVMENAAADIKKYAVDICRTNEENGVGEYVLASLGIEK